MSRVEIPRARAGGGDVARPVIDRSAAAVPTAVAQAADRAAEAGLRLERSRLATEMAGQRVALQNELSELRLDIERQAAAPGPRSADLSAAWEERVAKLRATRLEGIADERVRRRIEIDFDDIEGRHRVGLGSALIDRDAAAGRAVAAQAGYDLGRTATSDPVGFMAARATYEEILADQVAAGHEDQANALRKLQAWETRHAAGVAASLLTADPGRLQRDLDAKAEWTLSLSPARRGTLAEQAAAAVTEEVFTTARARIVDMLDQDPEQLLAELEAGEAWTSPLDEAQIATARSRARGELARREAAAVKAAEQLAADERRELADGLKFIADHGAGRVTIYDGFLENPAAQALPEHEAAVQAVWLRDNLPDFAAQPPDVREEMIAEARAEPANQDGDVDLVEALEAEHDRQLDAWRRDPIAAAAGAGYVIANLPLEDPQALTQALAGRRGLAAELQRRGFIDAPAHFSKAELEQLQEIAKPGGDVETRLQLAGAVIAGFQQDAPAALDAMGAGPVFSHAGRMLAAGGAVSTARAAFQGEAALATDGSGRNLLPNIDRDVLIAGLTGETLATDGAAHAAIRATADAIYAAGAAGIDPRSSGDQATAEARYEDAVHQALGRSAGPRGEVLGGVLELPSRELVLLPPDVSQQDVSRAWDMAADAFDLPPARVAGASDAAGVAEAARGVWASAGSANLPPTFDGVPLEADHFDQLTFRADGQGGFYLLMRTGEGLEMLTAGDTGEPYRFDLRALLREQTRFQRGLATRGVGRGGGDRRGR